MHKTTKQLLLNHLQNDLQIENNALIWLHLGIKGLGFLEDGLLTITQAFKTLLNKGILITPTFSYSWAKNENFYINDKNCNDIGVYANYIIGSKDFVRNQNPNFSIGILDNTKEKLILEKLINKKTMTTCFGKNSVFDLLYKYSKKNPSYILLLGGAHDDVFFRTTFIHYIEEKMKIPYRYNKSFYNPLDRSEKLSQFVRYLSKEEYIKVNNFLPNSSLKFPIKSSYDKMCLDLQKENIINFKKYGYSISRYVKVDIFCDWLENKIKTNPYYLV